VSDEAVPNQEAERRRNGWSVHKARQEIDASKSLSDRDYWLSLSPEDRSWAVWDLTVPAWEKKGIDITKSRSDRTEPWRKRRLSEELED